MGGYIDKAKQWKQEIKRAYPRCKVSVTVKNYDSIYIKLLAGDFPMYADNFKGDRSGYEQLNHYQFMNDNTLSPEMKKFWKKVDDIGSKILGNQTNDDHDPMTDYFSINYYLHYHIGEWNKPYVNTKDKTASKIGRIASRVVKDLVTY